MIAAVFSRRFAASYFSTLAFIALCYFVIFGLSPFHRGLMSARLPLGFAEGAPVVDVRSLFQWLIALYALALIPFYGRYPWLRSSAAIFLQGLWFLLLRLRRPLSRAQQARAARKPLRLPWRVTLSPTARQAGLKLLLKFYFAPLMINWCLAHVADMRASSLRLSDAVSAGEVGRALFDHGLYWSLFQLILFVDTLLFAIGYIVEMPALKNRIRSVDPTFFGWFICLCCYPPFNDFTRTFFAWQSADFPRFQSDAVHITANVFILVLLAIYSWASIALGFRCSNLTNRGIVARGPYAFVRHPAYFTKNLAWWIGAFPALYLLGQSGEASRVLFALLSLAGWSAIYMLRAITEERHLLMADNGYADYMARVRWRFIPRVF